MDMEALENLPNRPLQVSSGAIRFMTSSDARKSIAVAFNDACFIATTFFENDKNYIWCPVQGLKLVIDCHGLKYHYSRAPLKELRERLFPDLDLKRDGTPCQRQPRVLKDKPFLWWLSQLAHHGLPFAFTAQDAKCRLQHAMVTGTIEIPERRSQLERELRELYESKTVESTSQIEQVNASITSNNVVVVDSSGQRNSTSVDKSSNVPKMSEKARGKMRATSSQNESENESNVSDSGQHIRFLSEDPTQTEACLPAISIDIPRREPSRTASPAENNETADITSDDDGSDIVDDDSGMYSPPSSHTTYETTDEVVSESEWEMESGVSAVAGPSNASVQAEKILKDKIETRGSARKSGVSIRKLKDQTTGRYSGDTNGSLSEIYSLDLLIGSSDTLCHQNNTARSRSGESDPSESPDSNGSIDNADSDVNDDSNSSEALEPVRKSFTPREKSAEQGRPNPPQDITSRSADGSESCKKYPGDKNQYRRTEKSSDRNIGNPQIETVETSTISIGETKSNKSKQKTTVNGESTTTSSKSKATRFSQRIVDSSSNSSSKSKNTQSKSSITSPAPCTQDSHITSTAPNRRSMGLGSGQLPAPPSNSSHKHKSEANNGIVADGPSEDMTQRRQKTGAIQSTTSGIIDQVSSESSGSRVNHGGSLKDSSKNKSKEKSKKSTRTDAHPPPFFVMPSTDPMNPIPPRDPNEPPGGRGEPSERDLLVQLMRNKNKRGFTGGAFHAMSEPLNPDSARRREEIDNKILEGLAASCNKVQGQQKNARNAAQASQPSTKPDNILRPPSRVTSFVPSWPNNLAPQKATYKPAKHTEPRVVGEKVGVNQTPNSGQLDHEQSRKQSSKNCGISNLEDGPEADIIHVSDTHERRKRKSIISDHQDSQTESSSKRQKTNTTKSSKGQSLDTDTHQQIVMNSFGNSKGSTSAQTAVKQKKGEKSSSRHARSQSQASRTTRAETPDRLVKSSCSGDNSPESVVHEIRQEVWQRANRYKERVSNKK